MTATSAMTSSSATALGLSGRSVLVTGGATGIGLAIAEAFAQEGCRLLLVDVDAEKLDLAVERLSTMTKQVGSFVGSVADEVAVDAAFAQADAELQGIDVLVNNAGIAMNVPTVDLSLSDWQQALDVNLTGVFLCSQMAARRMLPKKSGVILNLSSMYGVVAAPERLAYCATKSAVAMMTKVLAIEWASQGVRVNALAPGYVKTALVEQLVQAERIDEASLTRRTPLGRLGNVKEIAELAVYLASDKASYITGQVVGIDGGWTAYGYV